MRVSRRTALVLSGRRSAAHRRGANSVTVAFRRIGPVE